MESPYRPWRASFTPDLPRGDEATIDPCVTRTTRVGRRTHTHGDKGERVAPAHAGEQVGVVALFELRQLVEADEVIATTLVLEPVIARVEASELDAGCSPASAGKDVSVLLP